MSMSKVVYWVLELSIRPGALPDLEDLMKEMVAATAVNEPGTLNYEWTVAENGRVCHIFERYADSAAVMVHLATFGEKFADRFMNLVEPTRIVIYGNPDEQVKGALADLDPLMMAPIGGFSR
jgi:quinol monooxygenase YgiN